MGMRGKKTKTKLLVFVACLTSQRHAHLSQGRICSDNYTCCHTELEDQTAGDGQGLNKVNGSDIEFGNESYSPAFHLVVSS